MKPLSVFTYEIEDVSHSMFFSASKKWFIFGALFTVTAGIAYYFLQKNKSDTHSSENKMAEPKSTHLDAGTEVESDSTFSANDGISDQSAQPLQPPHNPAVETKRGSSPVNHPGTLFKVPSGASIASEMPPKSSRNGSSVFDEVSETDYAQRPAAHPVPKKDASSSCSMM